MTDYVKYPKPKADKNAGRSASKVSNAPRADQHHKDGTMGKHQRTGDGMENNRGGGGKKGY